MSFSPLLLASLLSPLSFTGAVWQNKDTHALEGTGRGLEGLNGQYSALKARKNLNKIRQRRYNSLQARHRDLLQQDLSMLRIEKVDRKNYKIQLTDHRSEYTGPIEIGTPGQGLDCIFDTGSSMAWVFSTKCRSSMCDMHTQFDATKSSTYSGSTTEMHITFGTGSLRGVLAKDTVSLGGMSLHDQGFGEILQPIGSVFQLDFDGICGMSYRMSKNVNASLLEGIERSSSLSEKSFTFYFGEKEAALVLGKAGRSLVNNQKMTWYPVTRQFYWESTLKDVKVGGKSILSTYSEGEISAVFDTGTSVLTMPTEDAGNTMALLQSSGVTCDMIEAGKAPKICYEFEGLDSICIRNWYERSIEGCTASLMTLDLTQENVFILGQPFFNEFITTFDVGNNRIGVAPVRS
uniref:Peptidase A1 domain-containing protein n=1 Tax=Lotharella globosa TaxID=91324 RepID=A0A7S3ZA18_9EUKA|eukprot:CAMPEP_0167782352 /NCGR_PEP_ID=MMETSP0111_2-20121227/6469_1 /TAXON_ID=91324 /ORGANISM="Lotharella globosa, Strain CCCM811" /LENGTH=404 /DNA_ID=CAMNT_0007673173 /DNA_START=48 /DNA_END=1262 /DNA_ORIENTATION=-